MKQRAKAKIVLLILIFTVALLVGCRKTNPTPSPSTTPPLTSPTTTSTPMPTITATASPQTSPDMNTTASIVNTAAAFEKAIGKDGTWIICLLNDLKINKDIVMQGEFTNGKKDTAGKDIIQRKIALYTQDQDRNVTNRFTLTAPKLTIESPNASIQNGTFKGDLYVTAKNFELVGATVDGNVHFTNNDAKSTFKMDTTSKVTGKQELKSK